ncbi:MAG TPA: nicotinate-nucleotide adenylyltransferase [Gemmataceae bacterium]|nr:nicotinate-nucleotide adenylyltransferase [Gemmataceae bacterium]
MGIPPFSFFLFTFAFFSFAMRIGVFGGTFDPVHLGHLILAEQCCEQGRLDQVWFVPAASPPHKQEQTLTPFAQRVEMLALAIAGQPAFRIDELEKDRPGPSYTVHTLEEIKRRQPDDELFLPIGSDTLLDLMNWYQPQRVVAMAGLLVTHRPGWPLPRPEDVEASLKLPEGIRLRLQTVEAPLIDIQSRDLRRRASENRSLRYLVPRAVEAYIHDKRLYRKSLT